MKKIIKKIYNLIPFKCQLYSMVRFFWSPSKSVYQHLHFHGPFSVSIDDKRSFKLFHYGQQIENEIFWQGLSGGWEKESVKIWARLCSDATVILDVGANTGLYALVAKTMNPAAQVFAFEPVARVFDRLKQNVVINHFQITCEKVALSNYDGTAKIFDTQTDHILSVTVNKNLLPEGTKAIEVEISVCTLAGYCERNTIPKIDLIKLDVETHEPEVLQGMGDLLKRYRPTMLIEILNDECATRIEALVDGLEYLYFDIDEMGKVIRKQNLKKSSYYNYLFCSKDVAIKLGLLN